MQKYGLGFLTSPDQPLQTEPGTTAFRDDTSCFKAKKKKQTV